MINAKMTESQVDPLKSCGLFSGHVNIQNNNELRSQNDFQRQVPRIIPDQSKSVPDNVLENAKERIRKAFSKSGRRKKLTAANVKSIMRYVLEHDYIMPMVQNMMNAKNENGQVMDPVYVSKFTRAKVKELREKNYALPWPVSTPLKKSVEFSKQLLDQEYSDESASDEDYLPNEEEISDDEVDVSRKHKKIKNIRGPCLSKPVDPVSEDEGALVIAMPEVLNPSPSKKEADKIAFRTRSKLSLNDTPLETIEGSFMPPDITVDMYDIGCDDQEWQEFLCELNKPYEPVSALETSIGEPETEDDPEFKVQEGEPHEEEDEEMDESLCEDTDEIAKEELNALMDEIIEFTQQDLSFLDQVNKSDVQKLPSTHDIPSDTVINAVPVQNVRTEWMIPDERQQLEEQMRMHVQLLAQSYLLSNGNRKLGFIHETSRVLLEELKMFASREMAINQRSAFYSHNLDGALELVKKFEDTESSMPDKLFKRHTRPVIAHDVREVIAYSKVFIYPELLPCCGFNHTFGCSKVRFCKAEDNLIALGLEQFAGEKDPLRYIQSLLIPAKKIEQIKGHIQMCYWRFEAHNNAVAFYKKYKQAPQFKRTIRLFDPGNVKAPSDYPAEILPKWMQPFSKIPRKERPTTFKVPEIPKYKQILPKIDFVPVIASIEPFGQCILPAAITPIANAEEVLKDLQKVKRARPKISKSTNFPTPVATPDRGIEEELPLETYEQNSKVPTESYLSKQSKKRVDAARSLNYVSENATSENLIIDVPEAAQNVDCPKSKTKSHKRKRNCSKLSYRKRSRKRKKDSKKDASFEEESLNSPNSQTKKKENIRKKASAPNQNTGDDLPREVCELSQNIKEQLNDGKNSTKEAGYSRSTPNRKRRKCALAEETTFNESPIHIIPQILGKDTSVIDHSNNNTLSAENEKQYYTQPADMDANQKRQNISDTFGTLKDTELPMGKEVTVASQEIVHLPHNKEIVPKPALLTVHKLPQQVAKSNIHCAVSRIKTNASVRGRSNIHDESRNLTAIEPHLPEARKCRRKQSNPEKRKPKCLFSGSFPQKAFPARKVVTKKCPGKVRKVPNTVTPIDVTETPAVSSKTAIHGKERVKAMKKSTDTSKEEVSQNVPPSPIPHHNIDSDVEENEKTRTWTVEDDRLIIAVCQKSGINEEAFGKAASLLGSTTEKVEKHFLDLLKTLADTLKKRGR